ncbi:MAG: TatD family hydrolase [Eubacteriales bacterium]|nr:TatD family hydrolase [Eubacteriales bacterium]
MQLYDSHCHLNDEDFREDLVEVYQRALDVGVERMMVIACDLDSMRAIESFIEPWPKMRGALGLHPQDAKYFDDSEVEALLFDVFSRAPKNRILALGEIGLDYYYENTEREIQKRVFRRQIEIAHELNLPIIIHDRDAHRDCLDILQGAKADGLLRERAGVFHCYSGSPEMLRELFELGFYIGFDGPLTFKNSRRLPEVLAACPLDRFLIETDSPYLSPEPRRGRRNEPSHLIHIAAKIAELRGLSLEAVAERSYANTLSLWGD